MNRLARAAILTLLAVLSWCSPPPARADEEAPMLFERTIATDIATAGFYELIAWLESLGLATRGDRGELERRVANHYGVSTAALSLARGEGPESPQPTRSIVIDSATRTRYFTITTVDETHVQLSGGVVVTLRDDDTGSVHRIEADQITLNETLGTLAASGSVVYTLEREGSTERFVGEALAVDLDSFSGGFVRGVTERERRIDGTPIDFLFSGTYITRSAGDVVVIEDGTITSSKADPPNYHIRARKIWVLAPGEWGLLGATLYIGRIPMFYLPAFFKPGNDLFFNPSVGTRTREGGYIQTTTYLVGEPEERDSPFSLLQLDDDAGRQTDRRREGLFLVPSDRDDPATDAGGTPGRATPAGDTVKVLADLYTKLGAIVGVEVSVREALPLRQVRLYAALAASRHLYEYRSGGIAFSPFIVSQPESPPGSGPTTAVYYDSWNRSRIFGSTVPFRWGLDFQATIGQAPLRASLRLDHYSDTRFRSDFGDRAEQIDWLGLIARDESSTPQPAIGSLLWQISAAYTPNVTALRPYLTQFSVQPVLASLRYAARKIEPDMLSYEVLQAHESPESSFFYPSVMRLPEITTRVAGTLLQLPRSPAPALPAGEESDLPPLIAPWQRDEEPPAATERDPPLLVVPPAFGSLSAPRITAASSASLGYSLSNTTIVDHDFDSVGWKQPEDVDFSIRYRSATTRASGALNWRNSILSGLFAGDASLSASGQQRSVFDRAPSVTDPQWSALELQSWRFASFSTTTTLNARTAPFAASPLWSESTFGYTVNLLLYRYLFDSVVDNAPVYRSETIDFSDADFFRAHQVQSTAALRLLQNSQQLTLTSALPPLDERYTGRLALRSEPLRVTVATGATRVDDWVYDPLTAAVEAIAGPVTVTNNLSYDLNKEELTVNRTRATWQGVHAEVEARQSDGFDFRGPGAGWVADGDRRFRPVRAEAGITSNTPIGPHWRNRVTARIQTQARASTHLLRFTDSALTMSLNGALAVHGFLTLQLRMSSVNNQLYVYVPSLAERVGRTPRSLPMDLLRSINVFSIDDRRASAFNLQQIEINAVHDLDDWELTVGYRARPEIVTSEEGRSVYELKGVFTMNLQWRPIRELRANIRDDGDNLSLESDA